MKLVIKNNINVLELSVLLYTFAIAFCEDTGAMLVKIMRLCVIGAFLFYIARRGFIRIPKASYYIWCLSMGVFGWLSCLWAVSRELAVSSAVTQAYIIVVNCIIIYALYANAEFLFMIMKTVVFSGILHGLRVYLGHGFLVYMSQRGGLTAVENANVLANVACFAVIFSIVLLWLKQVKYRWLYISALFINVVFALLTASRKIFIYFGVFFAVYYIFKSKDPVKLIKNIVVIACISIVVLYAVMKVPTLYSLIGERIQTLVSGLLGGDTDGSTSFRMSLITWGMDWFRQNPLLGHGLNCYKYLLGTTYDTWVGTSGVYAHNNYIELLVDLGLVGTVMYYLLYIQTILKSYRLSRYGSHVAVIALSIIMVFVVGEYGQVTHMNAFLQEVILLTWFMACGFRRKKQDK